MRRSWVAGFIVAVVAVAGVLAFATDQAAPKPRAEKPSEVLDLTNWSLTLPIAEGDDDDATAIKQPALDSFVDRFFHLNKARTGVVFRAPIDGATTSGSKYPRSELRETNGDQEAAWSNRSGSHVMTITQAITATPRAKPEVVAGQIHDAESDLMMIRLEGNRLFVEHDGDEVGVLDPDYRLGTRFTVQISATPDGIRTTYNGKRTVDLKKVGEDLYFKAGCYTQSNEDKGDKPGAFGEVVIFDLSVHHRDNVQK